MSEAIERARDRVMLQADMCECGSGDSRDLWNQAVDELIRVARLDGFEAGLAIAMKDVATEGDG